MPVVPHCDSRASDDARAGRNGDRARPRTGDCVPGRPSRCGYGSAATAATPSGWAGCSEGDAFSFSGLPAGTQVLGVREQSSTVASGRSVDEADATSPVARQPAESRRTSRRPSRTPRRPGRPPACDAVVVADAYRQPGRDAGRRAGPRRRRGRSRPATTCAASSSRAPPPRGSPIRSPQLGEGDRLDLVGRRRCGGAGSSPVSASQPWCLSSASTSSSMPSPREATVLTIGGRQSLGSAALAEGEHVAQLADGRRRRRRGRPCSPRRRRRSRGCPPWRPGSRRPCPGRAAPRWCRPDRRPRPRTARRRRSRRARRRSPAASSTRSACGVDQDSPPR